MKAIIPFLMIFGFLCSAWAKTHVVQSLQGTDVDGDLRMDKRGHLNISRNTRLLFDYFLSTHGEQTDAAIRDDILDEIHRRLDGPAVSEATELLDRYLAYRDEAKRRFLSGGPAATREEALIEVMELRREIFGPHVANALFGDSEHRALVALERDAIQADGTRSPAAKAQSLRAIEATLPAHMQKTQVEARSPVSVERQVNQLRAQGANPEAIHLYRSRHFGQDGADRLAKLDAQRAEWTKRITGFRRELAELQRELGNGQAYETAKEALLQERFGESEQRRVRALQRIAVNQGL